MQTAYHFGTMWEYRKATCQGNRRCTRMQIAWSLGNDSRQPPIAVPENCVAPSDGQSGHVATVQACISNPGVLYLHWRLGSLDATRCAPMPRHPISVSGPGYKQPYNSRLRPKLVLKTASIVRCSPLARKVFDEISIQARRDLDRHVTGRRFYRCVRHGYAFRSIFAAFHPPCLPP